MKATADRRLTQAALITATDLDALTKAVAPYLPQVTASAECLDGITRHFDSVRALTEYDNASARAVRAFTLNGRSTDRATYLRLSIDSDASSNIRYSLEGDEPTVFVLDSALDSFFSAIRPGYWFLARIDFATFLPLLWSVLLLAVAFSRIPGTPSSPFPRFSPAFWSAVLLLSFAVFLIPYLLSHLFNRLRGFLFPMSAFCWGQGLKRHDARSFLRTFVILGLILCVIGSVIAALLVGR